MSRRAPGLAVLLALGLLTAVAGPAAGHGRSMSWSTWQLEPDGARVELRIKLLELTRRPPDFDWPGSLPGELALFVGDEACTAEPATRAAVAPTGWAVFRWRVRCAASGPRRIATQLLADAVATHTHFVRVLDRGDGAAPGSGLRERILTTRSDPTWLLDAPPGSEERPDSSLAAFLWLGVEHIATGYDHIAFVLALLLLAASFGEVAALVTAFTVAHSLTLGLAVLGWVRPEGTAVEVLIGISIALVACENGWLLSGRGRGVPAAVCAALLVAAGLGAAGVGALGGAAWLGLGLFALCHFGLLDGAERPARLRAAVAFAFGLIHGFGFAGILMELELPAERLVAALFGFNVGVELGQLAIVAVVWPLLHQVAVRRAGTYRLLAESASAAILALGLFWAVSRNFG